MNIKRGFTLVELLVVIAIIGILAATAVISLNGVRTKAKIAATEKALESMIPVAVLCFDNGHEITGRQPSPIPESPGTLVSCPTQVKNTGVKITAGWQMCSDPLTNWPDLPSGVTASSCNSNQAIGEFSFRAQIDNIIITCSNNGCEQSELES